MSAGRGIQQGAAGAGGRGIATRTNCSAMLAKSFVAAALNVRTGAMLEDPQRLLWFCAQTLFLMTQGITNTLFYAHVIQYTRQ